MTEEYEGPLFWDELIGDWIERDQEREIAKPKHTPPPGFYDAFNYPYQDEESFGLLEYQQELAEIKRLQANKAKRDKKNKNQ